MKRTFLSCLALVLAGCALEPTPLKAAVDLPKDRAHEARCPPAGWDRARLEQLKTAGFEIADETARETFAKTILDCLANPDPRLRDGIAYEALAHMLRAGQLSDDAKHVLLIDLSARLRSDDPLGFTQPFAALVLSEVARADRIEAFLTDEERAGLLAAAQRWFIGIADYRGFDDKDGWRHGVAHGSDLLMQLALNPRIDAAALKQIVSAITSKVAPRGVSYIDGESERLARPVVFAARRAVMTEDEWRTWLVGLATPPAGMDVFGSRTGLAWRHDTMAFLEALYLNVTLGSDKADDVMRPGLEAALKAMP